MNDFYTHAFILVLVMGVATIATRVVPFMIFGKRESVPSYILYLGDVLPYASMGLLVVYCLKDITITTGTHALPELIAMAVVVVTYLWKRNTIMTIIVSTAVYMLLVQVVFV